jgi:sec-independent protein translocase protein TatA
MPDLGWQELLTILITVVITFGAGKLPEIGGAMGKSIKEFKKEADLPESPDAHSAPVAAAGAPAPVSGAAVSAQIRADEI